MSEEELTLEKIKELANSIFQTDGIASGRKMVLYTGKEGTDKFQHTMEVTNAIDMLDWLIEKNKITEDQKITLTTMLKSDDWDNFNLAIEIIKIKQYGTEV